MQQIPRACAALILIGFFLPWVTIDLGGLGALLGSEGGLNMSGYQFATTKGPMGEAQYALLFAPIVAIAAAAVHSRKGYATCAILAAGVILLVGPIFFKAGAAEMGVTRGYGVYMCFAGCLGMLISGLTVTESLPASGSTDTGTSVRKPQPSNDTTAETKEKSDSETEEDSGEGQSAGAEDTNKDGDKEEDLS